MTRVIKVILGIISILLILTIYYGCVSYLQLDMDPLNWNGFFRFITVIVIGSCVTAIASLFIDEL